MSIEEKDMVALSKEIERLLKVEEKLKESERHYRLLFNSMINGYATHEFIFDENGKPCDYRFIDVNPAFEKMTGIKKDVSIGKTIKEIIPNIEQYWIDTYGKVVMTGEDLIYENYVKEMDKYFLVYAFTAEENHFSVIISDITKQKRMEEALYEEKERLRITLQSIGDGIITTDTNEKVISLNTVAEEFTGWTTGEAYGKTFEEIFHITNEYTGEKAKNPIKDVLFNDRVCLLENHTILTARDGTKRFIADSAAPIKNQKGNTIGVVMVFRDVTDRKLAEMQLKQSAEIIEKMQTGIYVYCLEDFNDDRTLKLINANEASTTLLGLKKDEILGKYIDEIFPNLRNGDVPKKFADVIRTGIPVEIDDFSYNDNNIYDKYFSFKALKVQHNCACILFENVTEKKKYMDEVKFLSYHDSLTGLYSRAYLVKELERLVENHVLPVSVIMGDVNGLKLINDVYGHDMGDKLLKSTARILKACCPQKSIISRWGGDEFTILLPETTSEQASRIVDMIKNACLNSSFEPAILSISLGTSTKMQDNSCLNDILCEAENMMYTNKLVEGKSIRSTIIASLQKTLYERSCETEEHAVRMMRLANLIGNKISLSQYEMDEMKLLTLLHDIGKIGIADCILNKADKLSSEEWCEMKKHPEIGYRIAQATPELSHISELILCHHEHWDGSGYPQGLKKENIPKLSRILAIIDAYDVMTNGRPYKAAIKKEEAVNELVRCSGTQFDPDLTMKFVDLIK